MYISDWKSDYEVDEIAEYEKVAKFIGEEFNAYHVHNWLGECGVEDGDDYELFHRAVENKLGVDETADLEGCARLSNVVFGLALNGNSDDMIVRGALKVFRQRLSL